MTETRLERRLRWAGLLIALGVIVESITLAVPHPLAFVAFIVIACPLMGAGSVLFLVAVLMGDSA